MHVVISAGAFRPVYDGFPPLPASVLPFVPGWRLAERRFFSSGPPVEFYSAPVKYRAPTGVALPGPLPGVAKAALMLLFYL